MYPRYNLPRLVFLAILFMSLAAVLYMPPRVIAASPAIKNFGEVEPGILYRGAQPDGRGLLDLAIAGIRTVIDLRTGDRTPEKTAAEALGLRYVNQPLNGVIPSKEAIDMVLVVIRAQIDAGYSPIFVHCQHGQDRTGTVVACWRVKWDYWTNQQAFAEARFFGINPMQLGMRHYIKHYTAAPPTPAPASAPAPVAPPAEAPRGDRVSLRR